MVEVGRVILFQSTVGSENVQYEKYVVSSVRV